jgi:hypothetical protein
MSLACQQKRRGETRVRESRTQKLEWICREMLGEMLHAVGRREKFKSCTCKGDDERVCTASFRMRPRPDIKVFAPLPHRLGWKLLCVAPDKEANVREPDAQLARCKIIPHCPPVRVNVDHNWWAKEREKQRVKEREGEEEGERQKER